VTSFGATFRQQIKLGYIIQMAVFVLVAVLVFPWIAKLLDFLTIFGITCPGEAGFSCLGVQSIFCLSLGLASVHVFVFLACLCKNDVSKGVNEGCWVIKVFAVIGIYIALLFAKEGFVEKYRYVSFVAGILFFIVLMIMLLDLGYSWSERWVELYEVPEQKGCYGFLLIFCSIAMFGLTIMLICFNFMKGNEGPLLLVKIVHIIVIALMLVLTVIGINPKGSLLTYAFFSLYVTFLCWSAITSYPFSTTYTIDFPNKLVELIIGGLLVLIYLVYMAVYSIDQYISNVQVKSKEDEENLKKQKEEEEKEEEKEAEEEEEEDKKKKAGQNPEERNALVPEQKDADLKSKAVGYQSNNYLYFHLIMIITSIYLPMLITNWGGSDFHESSFNAYKPSKAAFWVKTAGSWISSLFYIWSLIAPRILTSRQF